MVAAPSTVLLVVSAVLALGATTLVFLPHWWAYGGGGRISPRHQELHQRLHFAPSQGPRSSRVK